VEQCDDGNEDNADACLSACLLATCGDGVVQADVEECDDGNKIPDDGCSDSCIRDRLVFLTEEILAPPGFNSLFGADNLCRKTAMTYGYPSFENFRAWLSDDTTSPATSFFQSEGRYVMVTDEVVATSWADLVDGTLVNGIDRTLSGEKINGYAYCYRTRPSPTDLSARLGHRYEDLGRGPFPSSSRQPSDISFPMLAARLGIAPTESRAQFTQAKHLSPTTA